MRQSDSDQNLLTAVKTGDAKQVEFLLKAGAEVDAADSDGWTALIFAAEKGHANIVEVLLKNSQVQVNVNAVDSIGWTALMFAIEKGSVAVVELLLERGANINAADPRGWTALMVAAEKGHANIVEVLLRHGADVNAANARGRTALRAASYNGHANVVKLLLVRGAKIQTELQDNAIIKAAIKSIAEERAEARVLGHELLDQQQAMPSGVAELCVSYVSGIPVDSKEFVSAVGLREEARAAELIAEETRVAELRAEQADVGIDDEKQQSRCE